MNEPYKSFLDQFAAAKKEVAQLREVMQDSARLATLSYPLNRDTAPRKQEPEKKS